jgi:photosystem II stability/assembly factor-like uncharacterized protein
MRKLRVIILLAILCSCNWQTKSSNEGESKRYIPLTVPTNQIKETDGIVYFSSDNGLTWENKSEGLPKKITLGLGAIATSDSILGIATKENGIYFFDFNKELWVNIPTDKKILENNPGTLTFFKGQIFIGTQFGGVFSSANNGKSWTNLKIGLTNLTIRKLVQIDNNLYAGTDAGLFTFNDVLKNWELEYGNSTMQVNGITELDESIYIGTNQGAFTTPKDRREWKLILTNYTLHNISSDDKTIYAMTYNLLLSSVDKGKSWRNIQKGLPPELYTFNVIKNGITVFAGQWDGVYRKNNEYEIWKSYSNGLPSNLAINNMKTYNGIIVVSGNERVLKRGVTLNK